MTLKRRRLIYGSQAEILRSYQRDNQFVKYLSDHFKELLHVYYKYRISWSFIQTDVPAKLLYFILTSGMGNQTLGEEYTGIVQANLKTLKVQSLNTRVLVALIECFGEHFVTTLLKRSQRWINSSRCTFTSEAITYFNNLLTKLRSVIPLLILFHRGIFHTTGRYPTLGKRFFGVDYAKVYGRRPAANINWGIKLLGFMMLVQCVLRLWQLETPMQKMYEIERNIVDSKNVMKCHLCLERTSTTATVCGHLFCWICIVEWLHTQYQCPLCREHVSPSRIVHLMNL